METDRDEIRSLIHGPGTSTSTAPRASSGDGTSTGSVAKTGCGESPSWLCRLPAPGTPALADASDRPARL